MDSRLDCVRAEAPADVAAIRRVHEAAFDTSAEARLVDALRDAGLLSISLVAVADRHVVGHVAFSPVSIAGKQTTAPALGLAPVAVLPEHQRRGIGSKLIRDGLDVCRHYGCGLVVVLGEPSYYHRFGFQIASRFGLVNEYGVDEPFMAIPLTEGAIPQDGGLVKYAPPFASLD